MLSFFSVQHLSENRRLMHFNASMFVAVAVKFAIPFCNRNCRITDMLELEITR